MSELTVSPKGFDESLHFLCFSLNTNMSLELSQGFVELHAREIHLIHNTAIKGQTERERKRRVKLGLVIVCHSNEKVSERACACVCAFAIHYSILVLMANLLQSYFHYGSSDLEDTHRDNMFAHAHAHTLCANTNGEDRV